MSTLERWCYVVNVQGKAVISRIGEVGLVMSKLSLIPSFQFSSVAPVTRCVTPA